MVSAGWKSNLLGNIATLQRGFDLPHRLRRPGNVPIVTSSGLEGTHSEAKIKAPGVVTGRYGTIGEVFFIREDFWPHNTTLYVRDFHGNDPLFVSYLLRTIDYQMHSGKTGVPGVNRNDLHEIELAIPSSVTEQIAIAKALSDADALIDALEQLIAKKRQVKQGAMQELLTGKGRLPGFEKKHGYKQTEVGIIPEDWAAVSILDMCDEKKGSIKIGPFGSQLKREYLVSSGYKVYGQENVYAQDIQIGNRYLTKEHFQKLRACELLPGDFIVSMMGTIGQCMIVPDGIEQGIIDSHLIRIRLNPKVVISKYLSYYYSSKLVFDQISRLQVGGIMAGLSSSIIKKIYVGLPNSIQEQTAIAEILSDMDVEIAALEGKLSKAREVKAGMMSVLLTGRVRLVTV